MDAFMRGRGGHATRPLQRVSKNGLPTVSFGWSKVGSLWSHVAERLYENGTRYLIYRRNSCVRHGGAKCRFNTDICKVPGPDT